MNFLRSLLGPSEREVMLQMVKVHAESERANMEVLKEWLGMFKAQSAATPSGWLADDEAVAAAEVARSKGLPPELATGDEVARQQWLIGEIDNDKW